MLEFILHKNPQEFNDFNEEFLEKNISCFIPTWEMLENFNELGLTAFFSCNFIDKEKDIFVYCTVLYKRKVIIHGLNWNEEVVKLASEKLNLPSIKKGCMISGNKTLVNALLAYNDINFNHNKSRIIYSCSELRRDAVPDPKLGRMEEATLDNLETLSKMSFQFQKEEYGPEATETQEHMKEIVFRGILSGTIYVWIRGNNVKSMLQIMPTVGSPRIGHYFTKVGDRNKGYGKALLYEATKMLLEKEDEDITAVTLESVESYVPSNKAFLSVGYLPIYNTTRVFVL